MNKIKTYFLLVALLMPFGVFAQGKYANVISYDWKITKDTTLQLNNPNLNISGWNDINIGVSWEHQGYFYAMGQLLLATEFDIPSGKMTASDTLLVTINLQGKVQEVYLNGIKIAGNLKYKRNPKNIEVPGNLLNFDKKNLLAIRIDDVSWTGGSSNNTVGFEYPLFGKPETVSVTTNAKDFVFTDNDEMNFDIHFALNQKSPAKVSVTSDFHKPVETLTVSPGSLQGDATLHLDKKLYKPGIYHLIATTEAPYSAQDDVWFAVNPEKISCKKDNIKGYKKWWDETINELHAVAPQTIVTKLPGNSDDKKDAYEIKFHSLDDVVIYGYMFVPKKEGKFPVIMQVPGYSMSYGPNSFVKNDDDVIDFGLNIRGHGNSTETINPGFDLLGYVGYGICNPKTYVYRGAYMDCLRAVEILRAQSQVDSNKVAVLGISQGGGLSFATAALAGNKVQVCAALAPFLGDLEHHAAIRTTFELEKEAFAKAFYCDMKDINKSLSYVDTKNMASWITAKVFMGTGLFDDDCPPHVAFVVYNKIKSDKTYKVYPHDSHMLKTGIQDGRDFILQQFEKQK